MSCSIHLGLHRVDCRPSHHMKAGWHIDAAKMRGSPSHHSTRTGCGVLNARYCGHFSKHRPVRTHTQTMFALIATGTLVLIIMGMTFAARMFANSPFAAARKAVAWACIAVSALTAMALILSAIYKGPNAQYDPGSIALVIRKWIVIPGNFAAFLLPVAVAVLLVALRKPRRSPSFLALAIAAIVSVPTALVVAVVISCNHAGACL
jgi:hypothetical protein